MKPLRASPSPAAIPDLRYSAFLSQKFKQNAPAGFNPEDSDIPDDFMPHQSALLKWAIRRGKAAIFADTGLGKSRMQVAWADAVCRKTNGSVLILAPLAVAQQTVQEGDAIGVQVTHCRDAADVKPGINITNYERLHKFDARAFVGVVLDESSCIKHHDTKSFALLTEAFRKTSYKLCATATPAPNDWTELGTHAEFLGICSRAEMLAEFFTHDGGDTSVWRLKGHAQHIFWKWVSGWGALIRKPSDLGFDDSAYALSPLEMIEHIIEVDLPFGDSLFASEAQTLSERRDARRASLDYRVKACADVVNADKQPWVVWCDLNAEGDALTRSIPGAVQISGSDDAEVKEQRLMDFASGKIRVLVSKPSICGFGLNWQHAARMAFVGVTDSFEAYYQAVRRCWRFGQKRPVNVHIFASQLEGAVVSNLRRKEREAIAMAESLSKETHEAVISQVLGNDRQTNDYNASKSVSLPSFLKVA